MAHVPNVLFYEKQFSQIFLLIFGCHSDDNQLLYSGTKTTLSASMILLISYAIKHTLPGEALADLLVLRFIVFCQFYVKQTWRLLRSCSRIWNHRFCFISFVKSVAPTTAKWRGICVQTAIIQQGKTQVRYSSLSRSSHNYHHYLQIQIYNGKRFVTK